MHYKIGNENDGYHLWCIPNWDNRQHWQMFQLYMLCTILILPSLIMTIAYSSISREILLMTKQQMANNISGASGSSEQKSKTETEPVRNH